LEEEVGLECANKYGAVTGVLIFEVTQPGYEAEEAVRIFVQVRLVETGAVRVVHAVHTVHDNACGACNAHLHCCLWASPLDAKALPVRAVHAGTTADKKVEFSSLWLGSVALLNGWQRLISLTLVARMQFERPESAMKALIDLQVGEA
jgi:hypothetical protein